LRRGAPDERTGGENGQRDSDLCSHAFVSLKMGSADQGKADRSRPSLRGSYWPISRDCGMSCTRCAGSWAQM
jgi:hypothetical protein